MKNFLPCIWKQFALYFMLPKDNIDGLLQGKRNSIANTLELRLSCTNPSICYLNVFRYSSLPWSTLTRQRRHDGCRCLAQTIHITRCITTPSWWLDILTPCLDITICWMADDLADNKTTLVLVMARCPQRTSNYIYLNECLPDSTTPYVSIWENGSDNVQINVLYFDKAP